MSGSDILAQIAANRAAVIAGTLLILTMGFALSALSAVFYPVGRRYSEALSMATSSSEGRLRECCTSSAHSSCCCSLR